jgi:ubiquinone/menaquinone biosynthesis C-methylase UbiE
MAELRERGFDVVGVDGSEDMLRQARALNPSSEIYCADVERLPFPDAFFDFVLCIEVLRYLPQSSECLREMARVLKPGGMCLFTALPLLNLNGYWLVNRLAGLLRPRNLVHLRQFFTISSQIRRQCLEARLLSPLVVGVYFGPVNWVERLAPVFLPRFLKSWERLDTILADRPALREFSNMFLVRAVREGQGHDSE